MSVRNRFLFAGLPVCRFAGSKLNWLTGSLANRLTIFLLCFLGLFSPLFAQENQANSQLSVEVKAGQAPQTEEAKTEKQSAIVEDLAKSENVTLEFNDADIRNVLKIISLKSGVNIVTTPEVIGNVSVKLTDVPWEKALDVILKTYGFGYEKTANIIMVMPVDKLTDQKKKESELAQIQPVITEVFALKFIDAQDAKKALDPQLSPRGKITVLEITGQAGWEFGAAEISKRKRAAEGRISRSKTIIISDIPPVFERIKRTLQSVDVRPLQILVEAKLVEVNRDKLREIGFNWGTGRNGQTSLSTSRQEVTVYYPTVDSEGHATKSTYKDVIPVPTIPLNSKGSKILGAQSIPTVGIEEFLFQKLTGTEFEAVFKALEEKGDANVLSAPHIMTLNNQEASILIGSKFPLIKTSVSTESGAVTGQSLDVYQDIGIQLNVVPQVVGKDDISLIIHPAVSSYTQTVKATSATGATLAEYPIILTREIDTQIQVKDGETVVIGGLLKDTKSKTITGIPILKDIPLLGLLFQHQSTEIKKMDLLIFISAHIAKEGEFSSEKISKLENRLGIPGKNIKKK